MKGILEFDLPEDREEFETAQNGWKYKSVIDELYSYIRTQTKYHDKDSITLEALREKLNEFMMDEELL